MDTAASSSGVSDAYAIPIATATRIAKQIVAGKASTRLHIGATAFLGVQVQNTTVVGVVSGGPAEAAGLQPGDVITAIDGTPVVRPNDIAAIVLAHKPGQVVTVDYTDATGLSKTATVTLASGPPQ
jgi:S1-C subfamily serine protease